MRSVSQKLFVVFLFACSPEGGDDARLLSPPADATADSGGASQSDTDDGVGGSVGPPLQQDAEHDSDAATHLPLDAEPPPDPCEECSQDEVCDPGTGVCSDLPAHCPCPEESYCDLAENRCVAGCREDDGCAGDRICVDGMCRDGCRQDAQCGAGSICENLGCRLGCRGDEHCGRGDICDALACRAGCRNHGDCELETFCQGTRCVPGCASDAGCREGDVCDDGACRPGCRRHTECGDEQFCDAARSVCSDLRGSGSCLGDSHCAEGELCDLRTLRCTDDFRDYECSDSCFDCGHGDHCVNGWCQRRAEGDPCIDPGADCGKNFVCAPVTLTCQPNNCGGAATCRQNVGIGAAVGSTCQSTNRDDVYCYCTDLIGDACDDGRDCSGLACVDGSCRERMPCVGNDECPGSNVHVCVDGTCVPYVEAHCEADADCPGNLSRCVEEIGRCGYGG